MSVWKDRYGRWRYRFQYQKENYSERGFPTKREALAAKAAAKKEAALQGKKSQGMAFGFAAEEYLDFVERSMEKETYRQKVRTYQGFISMFPGVLIKDVTASMIVDYLKTLKTNDQYNRHRKELSALFEYTKNILEATPNNPVLKISKLPHTPARKIIPTEKQVLSILMACNPESDERDLLLCVLLTVARIDEILRLRWEDVNFERKTVTKYTKKRKGAVYSPIVVPMNTDLYNVLWNMWGKRSQEEWVFYNEKTGSRYQHRPKFMSGLCKRAGVSPPFGFHALRHYMSSMMADSQKISTKTIQQFLGHQSIKTTEIYLHSVDNALSDAMAGFDGKFTGAGGAESGAVLSGNMRQTGNGGE